jgi:hypothetical protein
MPAMPRRDERGTGLVGTVAGVAVVLVLLLFAAQVLLDLYARSAVTAVAYDAARHVAAARVDHDAGAALAAAEAEAEQRARSELGRYGQRITFTWSVNGEAVRLRVQAATPHVGVRAVPSVLHLDHIDRSVTVRVEELQP